MPTFRAEVVMYFEADDGRAVPKRLRELSEAAESVGFEVSSSHTEEGDRPEPDEDGWTTYAPLK